MKEWKRASKLLFDVGLNVRFRGLADGKENIVIIDVYWGYYRDQVLQKLQIEGSEGLEHMIAQSREIRA